MSKQINKDIEVGDYIRTKSGKIRKVKTTVAQYYITDRLNISDNNQFTKEDIVKHSKNIIDLIEVGDFVNGREVKHIAMFEGFPNYPELIFVDEKRLIPDDTCENDEIKTILTKEQYSQNCYAVERN